MNDVRVFNEGPFNANHWGHVLTDDNEILEITQYAVNQENEPVVFFMNREGDEQVAFVSKIVIVPAF